MTPVDFPEANSRFTAPTGLTDQQVQPVSAFNGIVSGGSLDGLQMVVVAWVPDKQDLEKLNNGGAIYLSVLGGLPPHFLTTAFNEAIRPA